LLEEFGKCFDGADYIIVTDIYPASEQPLEGVTGEAVREKIVQFAQKKQVQYLPKDQLVEQILQVIQPDDLVVTLGAGDIYKINEELVERVRR
jgi:UDP-N-acetylmuramate--alanine ligase